MAEEFDHRDESAEEPVVADGVAEQAAPEAAADSSASEENPHRDTDSCSEASSEDEAQAQAEAASGDEDCELSELDEALLKVARLEDQLARRNADVYNVQQEYNGYVKRSKAEALNQFELGKAKVLESLISVLDNAYLAREHGELEGPAGKVVQELESTLSTNFAMERYGAVGDAFDPALHEALMHSTSVEVETEQVQMLMQPGYRIGEKVIRPARVGVVSPE